MSQLQDRDDLPALPDETLDDGEVAPPADAATRAWLAEQRFVHGLLRALHTLDPQTRQARIESTLARLPPRPGRVIPFPMLMAAAAVLVLALGIWFWPRGADLPRAEAMVEKALDLIDDQVDRRFVLTFAQVGGEMDDLVRGRFEITLRPGNRFLLVGSSPLMKQIRFGCDGVTLWLEAGGQRLFSAPLAEKKGFEQVLGDMLELGFLDLEAIVRALPVDFALQSVGREAPRVPGGPELIRVEADRLPSHLAQKIVEVHLLVEQGTGMIDTLELETEPRPGVRRILRYRYLESTDADPAIYRPPW